MASPKRTSAEMNDNETHGDAAAKKSRLSEGRSTSASGETEATTSASPYIKAMHEAARKLEYVTIPRPHWSLPEEYSDEEEEDGDDEDESHDNSRNAESIEAKKADAAAKEAEALKYDHKPAAEFPESPFIISKQAEEAYVGHHIAALKRDQDLFGMHIYNDWTGYGMQEVIENQLSAFNNTMNVNKGQEPDAVDLWIKLSVFAHWANGRELQPWMMMDDATKWRETGAMVGLMTLATLNALHRSGLLTKDSPIKDLGLIIALMGNFFADCASLTGEVPILEGCDEMETWQYEVVHYAKTAGVEIKGVHDIEKKFVEEHSSEEEVGAWKTREGVDRWGWKAKWKQFVKRHGIKGKIGGDHYDITKMTARERKKASFDKKDPLDPKNPMVIFD